MAKGGVIGNLRVNMGLDSAQFQAGLNQAQGSAEKFAQVLKTTMVAAAAAASAALAAVSVAVKRTIATANDLGDVADRLGVNVERLQELRYAAERGGMGVQNFDVALRRFIRRAAEAAKGTGAAKNAFKELGVTLRDTNGRLKPSEVLLHEVADAMQKVPNSADKLRLAFQMFDTDGAAMVNVLANGSDGMKQMAAEAQRLGLVLSEDTVRSAQAITDNFEMAGNVIGGMVNRLTAFLAPAIMIVSEAVVTMALKLHDLIDLLPVVAEYAAVAGGALALMAAPAILSSVASLTTAIGVGLVGAVRLLTAAIMANPLGALAVGITIAVTAIYHFRDEIQKAIGVDVVGIVKDAANMVIGSFVAAFEDIKFVWQNFPDIIGAAVIGAVNATISGVETMINGATSLLNSFIGTVNNALSMLPGGLQIGTLGEVSIGRVANEAANRLAGAVGDRNKAVQSAMNFDYIGAIGTAFAGSTPAVKNFSAALGEVNTELEDMGGSGGGKGGGGGKSKIAKVKDGVKSAATEMEKFVDAIAGSMSNAFQGLIDGSKSVKETLSDLLKQLASLLMNEGFKALVGGLFGGGGGGIFGGLGKLLGFKDGGSFTVGGSGGTDSKVVAFRATPGEMVDVRKGNQERHGGSVAVQVGVTVDDDGKIQAYVTDMGQKAAQAGAQLGVSQVKQQMPGLIANAQARSM